MSNPRIDKLLAKKAQIDAQLSAARARDREQKRKDDTRRKIIVGGLVQKHAELHPESEFTTTILRLIQDGVKTDRDRKLFDLDPLVEGQPPSNTPTSTRSLWQRVTGHKN